MRSAGLHGRRRPQSAAPRAPMGEARGDRRGRYSTFIDQELEKVFFSTDRPSFDRSAGRSEQSNVHRDDAGSFSSNGCAPGKAMRVALPGAKHFDIKPPISSSISAESAAAGRGRKRHAA